MLNGHVDFLFNIFSLRMTVVSVKTLQQQWPQSDLNGESFNQQRHHPPLSKNRHTVPLKFFDG